MALFKCVSCRLPSWLKQWRLNLRLWKTLRVSQDPCQNRHAHDLIFSDDADFTAVMEMLAVSGGSQRLCVDVTISDDDIVEYNETFHVVLTTNDDTISLDFQTAVVFIVNDDSESNCVPHDYNSSLSLLRRGG